MSEKVIIRHMHERRLGVSSYDSPLPEFPIRLDPDRDCTGRFETVDGRPLGGVQPIREREAIVWFGCDPTTASRIPPRRTKRSFRIRMNDFAHNREMVTESGIEYAFLRIKRAECAASRILDQPPPRHFVRPDGSWGQHTFDFLVEEPDGRTIAYAVRPQAKIDDELTTALRCVRAQSLEGFADAAVLVTERHVTKARLHNANEILDARRDRNEADVRAARDLVREFHGGVMLTNLVTHLGLGPRGRTALICLIDEGVLELVHRERIGATTLLRPTLSIAPERTAA